MTTRWPPWSTPSACWNWGHASAADYLARASLYQRLDCPSAERFDLEHALLLSEDPIQRLRLTQRLGHLPPNSVIH